MHIAPTRRALLAALFAAALSGACSGSAPDSGGGNDPAVLASTDGGMTFVPPTGEGNAEADDEAGASRDPSAPASPAGDSGAPQPAGDAGAPARGNCARNGARAAAIVPNHAAMPHALPDLPASDFAPNSGGDRTYALSPTLADRDAHRHVLRLSARERSEIAQGKPLTKQTSLDGDDEHRHAVTIACK